MKFWLKRKGTSPSEHMQLWMDDAESLGLSHNEQKGAIFLTAFHLAINSSQVEFMDFARRLSGQFGDPSDELGGNFYIGPIQDVLIELATKVFDDVHPRLISFGETSFPSFSQTEEPRLPDLNINRLLLSDCSKCSLTLLDIVGAAIDEDLEGAYLAGQKFLSAWAQADYKTTEQMIRSVLYILPPHIGCLHQLIYLSVDQIREFDAATRLFWHFVDPNLPSVNNLLSGVFWGEHFVERGVRRPSVWEANWEQLAELIYPSLADYVRNGDFDLMRAARSEASASAFSPPPPCSTSDRAARAILAQVKENYGLDLVHEPTDLPVGQSLDRRCCIFYQAFMNALINPDWCVG